MLLVKRPVEGMAYWGDADAPRARPDRLRPRLRRPAGLRLPRAEHRRHLRRAGHRAARPHPRPGQQRGARPVLPGAGDATPPTRATCSPASCPPCWTTSPRGCRRWTPTRSPAPAASCAPGASGSGRSPTTWARVLASVAQASGSVAEDLDLRSRRLRQDLSGALVGLVGELRAQARAVGEDQDYTDAVERAYAATRAWITDGLGVGEQAWRDEALRSHDGRPQQQPLRRRRAEPGPGGDQQLFRGDRRLLRRAGAGAVGPGRGDPPRAHGRAAAPREGRRRARQDRRGGAAPVRRAARRGLRALPAVAPGRRAAAHACGWTTAPSCIPGCAPSWTA